jgi:hypothetical protein
VSRLQAQLALQDNGTWQITNLGRRAITVDGTKVRLCSGIALVSGHWGKPLVADPRQPL